MLLFDFFLVRHTTTQANDRPMIPVGTNTLKSIKLTQSRKTWCIYGCVPEVYLFVFLYFNI